MWRLLPRRTHTGNHDLGRSTAGGPCAVPKLAAQALSWHFSTKDMIGLSAARRQ
jgi:hypothetical protein